MNKIITGRVKGGLRNGHRYATHLIIDNRPARLPGYKDIVQQALHAMPDGARVRITVEQIDEIEGVTDASIT